MRNVILVSLIICIAALAGGYSIVWYSQAAALKQTVEDHIAKINATQKYITYDAIETSGFPSNLYVSIVKPHFKGRIDLLLKSLNNPGVGAVSAAAMPQWDEDDLLDGRIVFGVNALSDFYTLSVKGDIQQITKIGDKTVTTLRQQLGNSSCILRTHNTMGVLGNLWNFESLTRDGPELLKNISLIDCNHAGNDFINSATKETLGSSGPFRFYITNTQQSDAYQIRLYTKMADMLITPQGDAVIANYFQAISPNAAYPINFSVYGKQNIEIDFSYNGPAHWDKGDTNPPIHIALSKFDITNDVYNHHMTLLIDNNTAANNRVAKLSLKAESNFSEQYDTLVQNALRSFIQQAHDSQDPRFLPLQSQFQKYNTDQLYSIIYPALFSLHSFGKLVEAVDIGFQGTPDLATGDVTLRDLELSNDLYGIKGNGTAKIAQKFPQSANLALACNNCLTMVDDITGYAGRLQKVMSYFLPEKADAIAIDPGEPDAIKKFLTALAGPPKDPNDKALHYTFINDAPSGMTLNGMKLQDVMALANEYLGPYMKPKTPPATPPAH